MPWEALAVAGVVALWAALGLVPWSAALIAARGRGALAALPVALAAGAGAGALVPALGAKGWLGFGASLGAAMLGGAVAVVGLALRVRRLKPAA